MHEPDPGLVLDVLLVIEEQLHAIAASPAAAKSSTVVFDAYPVQWLGERLGLSATEQHVLWVLLAQELSPSARRSIREINTEDAADPTIDTIRRAVYGNAPNASGWGELGPDGRLRRLALIERIDVEAGAPLHRQLVRLAPRVLALAHGEVGLDAEIAGFAAIDESEIGELEIADEARVAVERAVKGSGIVIVRGGAGTGRRSLLLQCARAEQHRVLVVDGAGIAKDREKAMRQLRIVARECQLLGLVPLVRGIDALAGSPEVADRLDLIESELSGLVLATTTRPIARRWRQPPVMIELPRLTGAQRATLWGRALPPASESDREILSTMYPLAPALIHAASAAALRVCGSEKMEPHHITAGIRSVLDDRLAGLATRIEVTQTWEDLILPEEQCTAVTELLARIRERRRVYEDWGFAKKVGRGLGVSALFSGPPGTGKTMCAGLVARELGTELYQVDLSKIVSKWIGETEKNLAALFDAAEAGHAILLFDEADAIFGKRTDVKSSNDRHANQETNYLLQRLESFAGICILTTNHEMAIDEAFRRRLSVHVRFPMPETDERKRLWQALIPASAPVSLDLRFDQLADSYAMSGGYIRNAVLRAAFLAADQNARIDTALLARAAQLEYEAMGKVVARR
jgi:AAA+ superfamily predicted ATPase